MGGRRPRPTYPEQHQRPSQEETVLSCFHTACGITPHTRKFYNHHGCVFPGTISSTSLGLAFKGHSKPMLGSFQTLTLALWVGPWYLPQIPVSLNRRREQGFI